MAGRETMTGIRFRLISTYLLIILLTVGLVELGIYSLINNYYITNISAILKNEQDMCIDLCEQLYYNHDLTEDSMIIAAKLSGFTNGQLQLIGLDGRVLHDSVNQYKRGMTLDFPDVAMALSEGLGTWQGDLDTGEPVYAITQVITRDGASVGALRFVSSLQVSYDVISQLMTMFIGVGIVIIIMVFLASLFMANSIIRPIMKLAAYAKEIAKGNYSQELEVDHRDEIGQLTEDLNTMGKELSKAEAVKDQFIGSISHELRTPLTSIKGWIVTLRTGHDHDDPLVEEGYSIIESETDRLTGLVNELLDFSRLTSHRLSVNPCSMNICNLLEYVHRQMGLRAGRQQIRFELTISDDVAMIDGDYNRLKQVFINLIDNAFKYTPEKGLVVIHCTADLDCCYVEIRDNGSGISSEDLPEVFNRYYQGKNAKEGSGIGLTLCNEIILLHGGVIEIESEEGTGTLVRVVLPYTQDRETVIT